MNICYICKNDTFVQNKDERQFDSTHHIYICKKCFSYPENKNFIISYSQCNKKYLLIKSDLVKIKTIHISNIKNNNTYYIFSDVHNIIVKKYGNYNKLKEILEKKNIKREEKYKSKIIIKEKKKEELINILNDYRIELQNYGDHYEYINYGKPTIKDIINNHYNKNINRDARIQKLANKLKEYNIVYCHSLSENKMCKDYINKIGSNKLDNVVDNIINQRYYYKNI